MNGRVNCSTALTRLLGSAQRIDLTTALDNTTEFSPAARLRRQRATLEVYNQLVRNREAQLSIAAAVKRTQFMADTANLAMLNPQNTEKLSAYIAQRLDWDIGQGGRVRRDINRVRTKMASELDYVSRGVMAQAADHLAKLVKEKLPDMPEAERRVVMNYAAEIGSIDRELAGYSRTAAIEEFNKSRIGQYLNWMINNTGLSFDEVDEITNAAARASQAFDELLLMSRAVGVNLDEVEAVGYVHRSLKTPFLKYIQDYSDDIFTGAIQGFKSLNSILSVGRKFNWLVPEDKVALSTILGLTPADSLFLPRRSRYYQVNLGATTGANVLPGAYRVTQVSKTDMAVLRRLNPNSTFRKLKYDNVRQLETAVRESLRDTFARSLRTNKGKLSAMAQLNTPVIMDKHGVWVEDLAAFRQMVGPHGPKYTRGFNPYGSDKAQVRTMLKQASVPQAQDIERFIVSKYKPTVGRTEITDFVGTEYFSLADDTQLGYTDLAQGRTLNTTEHYTWAVGRASDTTGSTYINENANVLKVNSNRDVFSVLASEIRKVIQPKSPEMKELGDIIRAKDESALMALSRRTLANHYDGLLIRSSREGSYASIDLGNLPDFYKDTPIELIDELFDPVNADKLLDYLRTTLGSEQIEALVDTGILNKVGMSSVELYEYMANKLELPFTSASQAINMNWREIYMDATSKLKESIATATFMTKLVNEGMSANWMVDTATFQTNPTNYRRWSKVNIDTAKALGVSDEIAQQLADKYLHPAVAVQIDGMIRMAATPLVQGNVARAVMSATSLFKKTLLTAIGPVRYVVRNMVESMAGSIATGGNLYTIPAHISNVYKFLADGTLDHLDDSIPRYYVPGSTQTMTQREAYRMFMRENMTGSAPGVTDEDWATGFVNIKDYTYHMLMWAMREGNIGPLERLGNLAEAFATVYKEGIVDPLFSAQAYFATVLEKTVQLNHFLGLLRPVEGEAAKSAFRYVSSYGTFKGYARTKEDLFDAMSTAFVNPFTAGDFTKGADKLGILMFATYALKTPFSVLKMVAQAPMPFVNWVRWEHLMAERSEEQYDIREIDLAEWEIEGTAYAVSTHINALGEKELVLLNPTANSVRNHVIGAANFIRDIGANDRIQDVDEYDKQWTDIGEGMMRRVALSSNPLIQTAVELLTKRDLLTDMSMEVAPGDKMPSFLLWHVNPHLRQLMYRILPITRVIDDWNPGEVFGSAPVRDRNGVLVYDGKTGLLGNERYPTRALDRVDSSDSARVWMYRVLNFTGFNTYIYNVPRNVNTNLRNLDATITEVKTQYGAKQKELALTPDRAAYSAEELNRRRKELEELASLGLYLELEKLKLTWYLNAGGELTPDQLSQLNDQIYKLHGEQGMNEITRSYERLLQEYGQMYDETRRMLYDE